MKNEKEKIIKNEEIPFSELRVIDEEGKVVGVMSKSAAIDLAKSRGLDLILVAPNAQPPVARILDYGKYKYELSKREQKAKKNQKIIEIKEMKFRPAINEHDYQTKLKHIRRFIEDGNKVKVTVMFRGREMAFMDKGKEILERIAKDVADIGTVEKEAKVEGRDMWMMLKPKNL
ncbi:MULTISPECIES: translation initiation factor IF-3 [Fervidobacterium]|uniref:Translation initiation factor IF-3 n=2 Tax=Fervidobacterium TaxID=2422 RepID=A0AAI8GCM8_FERIS|nr:MULTISPECIES: translation initiation factor IF-3 [Fervidobacterium]AMW32121.2 translation initiation factor IF-3 [Fervidobacterium islandicum]QAV33893.1 translation initiation factor IF-3 [Fervidobacterium changbaicum]